MIYSGNTYTYVLALCQHAFQDTFKKIYGVDWDSFDYNYEGLEQYYPAGEGEPDGQIKISSNFLTARNILQVMSFSKSKDVSLNHRLSGRGDMDDGGFDGQDNELVGKTVDFLTDNDYDYFNLALAEGQHYPTYDDWVEFSGVAPAMPIWTHFVNHYLARIRIPTTPSFNYIDYVSNVAINGHVLPYPYEPGLGYGNNYKPKVAARAKGLANGDGGLGISIGALIYDGGVEGSYYYATQQLDYNFTNEEGYQQFWTSSPLNRIFKFPFLEDIDDGSAEHIYHGLTSDSEYYNELISLEYLNIFKNHPYIFNLGHGILPETDPMMVDYLVKLVKDY